MDLNKDITKLRNKYQALKHRLQVREKKEKEIKHLWLIALCMGANNTQSDFETFRSLV